MESNEQTELTRKRGKTHRWRAGGHRGVRLGGRGTEQKGKRTHGYGQQCGDCWGEGGLSGLNGNEKNTIWIKF